MSDKRSNGELVKELLEAFSALKNKMEDPNYVQLEGSIKQLIILIIDKLFNRSF